MDAQRLTTAADLIRTRLGARFEDTFSAGMVKMRAAVQEGLDVDESAADALVKQLNNSRLVIFHPPDEVEHRAEPDVRNSVVKNDPEYGVLDGDLSPLPPQSFGSTMGIYGTADQIIPPIASATDGAQTSDAYIDRGIIATRDLGEADAFGNGGYWEVPELATGAITQSGGVAGPDYDAGRTDDDV